MPEVVNPQLFRIRQPQNERIIRLIFSLIKMYSSQRSERLC